MLHNVNTGSQARDKGNKRWMGQVFQYVLFVAALPCVLGIDELSTLISARKHAERKTCRLLNEQTPFNWHAKSPDKFRDIYSIRRQCFDRLEVLRARLFIRGIQLLGAEAYLECEGFARS